MCIGRRGVIVHRESRTFAHRTAALSRANHREVALGIKVPSRTLSSVHPRIDTLESVSKWARAQ